MTDNEEAIAELLYTWWRGNEPEPEWADLPQPMKYRWMRVARATLQREVDLTARLANNAYRQRFTERLMERLDRWQRGK